MDAQGEAKRIAEGGATDVETVRDLADELRDSLCFGAIAPMLIAVSRRALYDKWNPEQRIHLAATLRDHQQFGYARRLLGRVRGVENGDSEELRQQHALCTYKDMELPAARRLDRALEILEEGGSIADSTDAETLGIAGAIFKRRWEVDTKHADLESARRYYEQGFRQRDHPQSDYAGVNAAFVCDQLATLVEKGAGGTSEEATRLRRRADEIRAEIVSATSTDEWADAIRAEAFFGLGQFDEAREHLARVATKKKHRWHIETTAMQIAALARLRGFDSPESVAALEALVGGAHGALHRASVGKVGLALSGGGFRASLFHVGVLARLAECGVLRHVEVLSCVSGGSIVGAFYYLKLRQLLQTTPDRKIDDAAYVKLVREVAGEFLDGVRGDLRGRLGEDVADNWRMLSSSRYSRTDRAAELFDELFFDTIPNDARAESDDESDKSWRMSDLHVAPHGREDGFSLRYENWMRAAKVPILVLNATTLNTGHCWQFTGSWMGEPPVSVDERTDASRRLRRVYYRDAPGEHGEQRLGKAVAASAGVPGLFPPVTLAGLYEEEIDVELVDGGVHDNQGIASLIEQDCAVVLVSDASGQIRDDEHPARGLLGVAGRSNSVLMSRVRGAQYGELLSRRRSGTLRGLMMAHLRKGLPAPPRDWVGCQEPYDPEDDALPPGVGDRRPPYGIDEEVQRALSELRTDLDVFSDDEAYSLMAAGYAMTGVELPREQLDLPAVDGPEIVSASGWPFAAALERNALPTAESGLAATLRPGRVRFFRRVFAWRHRNDGKEKGWFRRQRERTVAVAGSVVRRGVVAPARMVVGAPFALVGALGTRLYRRLSGD